MFKHKKGDGEPKFLVRTQEFEISPDGHALAILISLSEVLRQVWNTMLEMRAVAFNEFLAPLYQELKLAKEQGEDTARVKEMIADAFKRHGITIFDQQKALTEIRASNEVWRNVPSAFEHNVLVVLEGAFRSFMSLRKKGDLDARVPGKRREGEFSTISGRAGFKVKDDKFILSCGKGKDKLVFPIPEYQQKELAKALRIKEFRISRKPRNLAKRGQFILSITYEINKPAELPFRHEKVAYVAVGASSIGVLSETGTETTKLWRPDKYWSPKISSVEARMARCPKGSSRWKRLNRARRRMQIICARQQKHNQQTVAVRLARKHPHIVVNELVVRSKKGKLADSTKPERRGKLGLNWAVQNTGSIARLIAHMEDKTAERGGSVRKHKLILSKAPPSRGHRNKGYMADELRKSFLQSLEVGVVSE